MPEFYGTATEFRFYHIARNHIIDPAIDDDEIASALLVASEWIDSRFRSQFGGEKLGTREQIREWPRSSAYDVHLDLLDGIPLEVERATYEAAAINLATPGALSVNFTPGKYKSVSVDGAVSVVYASINSVADAQAQFAVVNEAIAPILVSGASNISGMTTR